MAIARTGNIVGSISGNLGGVVFANTNQGLLVKHRPLKINQRTTYQLFSRAAYQTAKAFWPTLTTEQLNAWRTLAANTTITNRLGVNSNPSAHQIFIKMNTMRAFFGEALLADPPPLLNPSSLGTATISFTFPGPFHITFYDSTPWSGHCQFMANRPVRSSQTASPRSWKHIQYFTYVSGFEESVREHFLPILGQPSQGEFIHIRLRLMYFYGIQPTPWRTFTTFVL